MITARVKFEAFAGRATELAFLSECLAKAAGGRGSAVLIVGEAGLGKSRLVSEFHKAVAEHTSRFSVGACLDYARSALRPFLQILAGIGEDRYDSVYAAAQDESLQPADRRARLFDAILERLRLLAAGSPPVVLVIEDLHWADDTTLQMLEHLVRHIETMPICLLITCRNDAVRDDVRISSALSALLRHGARAVYLEPLMKGDVRFLLNSVLHQDVGLTLPEVERLEDLAAGNPLYLEELLRDAIDQQSSGGAPLRERVPSSLKAAVLERLGRLSLRARQILVKAAVLGDEFDLKLLPVLSPHGYEEIVDALQQAVDTNFVSEIVPDGRYRFRHALIREVLYSELTTPSAAILHGLAAEAIEKRFGRSERLAELAYHWSAASNAPMALRYNEAAGSAAMLSCTYRDAARFFRTALKFAAPTLSRHAELNEKLAYALYCDGSLDDSKQYFQTAIEGYLETASLKSAARLIDLLYSVYWYDGDTKGGLDFAATVLRLAEQNIDRDVRNVLLIRTAGFLNIFDMTGEAEELLRRVDKPERGLQVRSRVTLHELRAITLASTGHFSNAIREFQTALHLSQADQAHLSTSKVAGNLSTCYRLMGDLDEAERLARYALNCAEIHQLSLVHRCCRAMECAEILFLRGRLQEAADMTQQAVSDGVDFAGMRIRMASIGIPIALTTMREDLLARCDDDSIVELAYATRKIAFIAPVTEAFVKLYLHRGRNNDATALLRRAMQAMTTADHFTLEMLINAAKFGAVGDLPKARELVVEICARRPRLVSRAYTAAFDAAAAQRERSWENRKRFANVAAASFAELGMPIHHADALELGGRQREALAIYRRIGATADMARLERVFADRGDRGGRLTRRQAQIGKLIVAGASNREVAQRLHISEKTLANHLTGIYRRLEIDSRDALVTYLTERLGMTS